MVRTCPCLRQIRRLTDPPWTYPSCSESIGRFIGTSVPANANASTAGSTAEQLRILMRRVTQPVVLVTTEDVDCTIQRGLTVSSFTTICLTPSPFVCFSTRQISRAADLIAQRGSFIVQLLPSTAEFAKLAEAFSKSDLTPHSHIKHEDPFELGQWKRYKNWNLPVFDGVLGALLCKVNKTVDVGDHRLWIAEVEDVAVDDSVDVTALAYCGRKYRKEGDPLLPHDTTEE